MSQRFRIRREAEEMLGPAAREAWEKQENKEQMEAHAVATREFMRKEPATRRAWYSSDLNIDAMPFKPSKKLNATAQPFQPAQPGGKRKYKKSKKSTKRHKKPRQTRKAHTRKNKKSKRQRK
jgi:hypothetical protein